MSIPVSATCPHPFTTHSEAIVQPTGLPAASLRWIYVMRRRRTIKYFHLGERRIKRGKSRRGRRRRRRTFKICLFQRIPSSDSPGWHPSEARYKRVEVLSDLSTAKLLARCAHVKLLQWKPPKAKVTLRSLSCRDTRWSRAPTRCLLQPGCKHRAHVGVSYLGEEKTSRHFGWSWQAGSQTWPIRLLESPFILSFPVAAIHHLA